MCVSGDKAFLKERTASVQVPGRQECAWYLSGRAGKQCDWRGWQEVSVTSEDVSHGLSHPARQLCYHNNYPGRWMSSFKGTLWAWCRVAHRQGGKNQQHIVVLAVPAVNTGNSNKWVCLGSIRILCFSPIPDQYFILINPTLISLNITIIHSYIFQFLLILVMIKNLTNKNVFQKQGFF